MKAFQPIVAVLVATSDRIDLLTSLTYPSVAAQSRSPTRLVVVDDSCREDPEQTRCLVKSWHLPAVDVDFLRNRRSRGAAGAWNSGLDHLLRYSETADEVYVAFLDDDDEWLPRHLESSTAAIADRGLDMVATPFWRVEDSGEVALVVPPTSLRAADFLVGNPGVQGSNMVCRLSVLLQAGLFDEWLPSCTDRDLCIRIADLPGVRYGVTTEPTVRHLASASRQRLSTPGSTSKNLGLDRFDQKYRARMSDDQRSAFESRAASLFGWRRSLGVKPVVPRSSAPSPVVASPAQAPVHLVVGFIADTAERGNAQDLLNDLRQVQDDPDLSGLDVLILENGRARESDRRLRRMIENQRRLGLRVHLVDRAHHVRDASQGRVVDGGATDGKVLAIASARTVLQSYLYVFAKDRPGSVVWILDDDMRLSPLLEAGDGRLVRRRQDLVSMVRNLRRLRAGGCLDVALGSCTGAPPLPVAATVRVQLVDLAASLRWLARLDPAAVLPDRSADNAGLRDWRRDYYYDLSRRETDRLETPFWITPDFPNETVGRAFERMAQQAERILAGEQVFRPLAVRQEIDPFEHMGDGVQRGGNTFVLDVEALRVAPNPAPVVEGRPSRRSDMLWALFQKRYFGRVVRTVPIAAYQNRSRIPVETLDVERIVDDIRGYALFSALDEVDDVLVADDSNVRLVEDRIAYFAARTAKYLEERLAAFSLSFHRITGLARIVRDLADGGFWWSDQPHYRKSVDALERFAEHLAGTYRVDVLSRIEREALSLDRERVVAFLDQLPLQIDRHQRRLSAGNLPALARGLDGERVANAKAAAGLLASPGAPLDVLGSGKEGVALTDGERVYKIFDYWWKSSDVLAAPRFLRSLVGAWRDTRHLYPILEFNQSGHRAALVYPFEQTQPYAGGHGPGLVGLLEECWRHGIVCRNIDPDNLRVIEGRVRLIDYGSDIRALPPNEIEGEFMVMCQRAWMSFRWAANPDLAKVMRRALTDQAIPELDGFERFREAVLRVIGRSGEAENIILRMLGNAKRVLDYGCGRGALAQAMSRRVEEVVGYDPDDALARHWDERVATNLRLTHERSEALGRGPFDLVVCERVLCTIEDDDELRRILRDLRACVTAEGRVVVLMCNPHFTFGGPTPEADRVLPDGARYETTFVHRKPMRSSGRIRDDVHRPERVLRRELALAGLAVRARREQPTVDLERFEPASDRMLFELAPMSTVPDVTLLIKACALEAETLDVQVRHLVSQLETPRAFKERVLVLDSREEGFLRQHTPATSLQDLRSSAVALRDSGWIDRIVAGPADGEAAAALNHRWFGIPSSKAHASTGAQVASTLAGLEACGTRYVLQIDADVMVGRRSTDHDYLADMLGAMGSSADGLTVAFNIATAEDREYTPNGAAGPWRVEVRAGLIDVARLLEARPLPNRMNDEDGRLALPWHRAVDRAIQRGAGGSYRGGDRRTFYVHPPNARKRDLASWFAVLDRIEHGVVPDIQLGQPEWVGDLSAWMTPKRRERFVFVVSGRNVPPGRLRRCIDSLLCQRGEDWGVVAFDDASDVRFADYFETAWTALEGRCTVIRNRRRLGLLANMVTAIRHVCTDPDTVIATLDADDALIGNGVLARLAGEYGRGADVTVGSMLRTDKVANYPVSFHCPRRRRGGNVWQHLRSFRKQLFDAIPDEDLRLDGDYIDLANDWAYMLPIVEMAKRPVHIEDALYLHEPSGTGKGADREARDAVIARIVAKPSRKRRRG